MLTYALWPYRGDTGRWRFVLWADADKTTAVDLTGVTVAAEIRAPVTPLTCTVTLPNTIDVVLAASASAALPASASWDLQLTWPSGDVTTVVGGAVQAQGEVTGALTQAGGCTYYG